MLVRLATRLFAFLLIVSFAGEAAGQSTDALREGIAAFREGQYEQAAQAFEAATRANPDDAEAYFLLARVYAETPLKDRGRARRALDKALQLEPENVTYLVGRLQQLREESWNFFQEKIREQKRIELAHQILALDSTNAFAHEELGAVHIRDFWRYRNAIMLPSLRFDGLAYRMQRPGLSPEDASPRDPGFVDPTGELVAPDPQNTQAVAVYDPNEVFLADRFDLENLSEVGVPIQDLSTRAQRAYQRAIAHLEQALATDPRRNTVYDRMMEIFSLKGEYEQALEMLEQMYTFFPESPTTWMYLGLAHHRTGNLEAASKSFETAFSYMTEEAREAFERLDYLLPPEEQRKLEDDPVAYASRFWTSKDPRYLTPYNERKLEHYARLVYADLLYGSEDLNLRGWDTQRGQILVRYGVPQTDVVLVPGSTSRVNRVGGPQTMQATSTSTGFEDYQANPNTPGRMQTGMDMFAELNVFNIWDYGDFRFVFEDPFRNGEYRLYSPSAQEITQGVPPWINDYSIRAKETFARIPERYEYTAPGRQIEIPYLVNAFRGDGESADVYVHYGIPIQSGGADGGTINVTANVGAFLISDARDILVERRRTIYGLKGEHIRAFKDVNLWVDTQQMDAPAGTHEVSMEFETASGSTVAVQRRTVEIPDFSSTRLQLSDVLMAYGVEEVYGDEENSGSTIVRRGLSIDPAPWSVYSVEQPVYLYFEIYNLQEGADGQTEYEMEARLTPQDERGGIRGLVRNLFGGTEGVSVGLPGSGSSADEGHYLILDASNQEAGLYTLTLRVRDNVSGQTVEREKELFLE